MAEYDRNIIGNEYLHATIDERFIITDLQDWGYRDKTMIARSPDNEEWFGPVSMIDGCELLHENSLPIPLNFFTATGAKACAYGLGLNFAAAVNWADDISSIQTEMEVAYLFRNYVRSNKVRALDTQKTLSETLSEFDTAAIDDEVVLEQIWNGFIDRMENMHSAVSVPDADRDEVRERALEMSMADRSP